MELIECCCNSSVPTVAAAAAAAAVNVVVSADRPVMVLLGDLIAPGDVVVFNEA